MSSDGDNEVCGSSDGLRSVDGNDLQILRSLEEPDKNKNEGNCIETKVAFSKEDQSITLNVDPPRCLQNDPHSPVSDVDLLIAATYVNDARKGRPCVYRLQESSIRSYVLYNNSILRSLLYCIILFHLLLAVFEAPAVQGYELPYWATMLMEVVILLLYLLRFSHTASFCDAVTFWSDKKNLTLIVTVCLTFCDIFCYIGFTVNGVYTIRWSRPLRPLFLINFIEFRQIRRAFRNIRRTLPDILNVLFLFLLTLMIFALMAVKLFGRRNLKYPNGEPYFQNLADSFFDLYVLVTTANNPDVMMPAYDSNKWYVLFFIIFIIVCLYIFMSIFLAVIYNNYRKHLKNDVKKIIAMKRRMLSMAYDILKVNKLDLSILPKNRFCLLVQKIMPKRSHTYAHILWQVLDTDGNNYIGQSEFLQVADLLNVEISEVKDRTIACQTALPTIYNSVPSKFVQNCVKHKYFRFLFDAIIVFNAIFIALDYNAGEWFFLIVFSVEIVLKMYTFGIMEFFKRFWNVFDFVVIGSALLIAVIELIQNDVKGSRITLEVLLVLRVLRLVKIMGDINRFKIIITTIMHLGPSIVTYGGVLLVFYYVYAVIGMELFSGLVKHHGYDMGSLKTEEMYCGNSKLKGSDFWRNHYCNNNFNNLLQAMVVMFELTVVNQWHVITSGYVLATSKWARLFFFSFHITCVIVILNIFTAFVLEAFILEYTLSKGRYESALETKINELGLGLGSKPRTQKEENIDKQFLVENAEGDILDSDHNVRQLDPNYMPEGLYPNLAKETDIRFHLTSGAKDVEGLLQRMFENEFDIEDFETPAAHSTVSD